MSWDGWTESQQPYLENCIQKTFKEDIRGALLQGTVKGAHKKQIPEARAKSKKQKESGLKQRKKEFKQKKRKQESKSK